MAVGGVTPAWQHCVSHCLACALLSTLEGVTVSMAAVEADCYMSHVGNSALCAAVSCSAFEQLSVAQPSDECCGSHQQRLRVCCATATVVGQLLSDSMIELVKCNLDE